MKFSNPFKLIGNFFSWSWKKIKKAVFSSDATPMYGGPNEDNKNKTQEIPTKTSANRTKGAFPFRVTGDESDTGSVNSQDEKDAFSSALRQERQNRFTASLVPTTIFSKIDTEAYVRSKITAQPEKPRYSGKFSYRTDAWDRDGILAFFQNLEQDFAAIDRNGSIEVESAKYAVFLGALRSLMRNQEESEDVKNALAFFEDIGRSSQRGVDRTQKILISKTGFQKHHKVLERTLIDQGDSHLISIKKALREFLLIARSDPEANKKQLSDKDHNTIQKALKNYVALHGATHSLTSISILRYGDFSYGPISFPNDRAGYIENLLKDIALIEKDVFALKQNLSNGISLNFVDGKETVSEMHEMLANQLLLLETKGFLNITVSNSFMDRLACSLNSTLSNQENERYFLNSEVEEIRAFITSLAQLKSSNGQDIVISANLDKRGFDIFIGVFKQSLKYLDRRENRAAILKSQNFFPTTEVFPIQDSKVKLDFIPLYIALKFFEKANAEGGFTVKKELWKKMMGYLYELPNSDVLNVEGGLIDQLEEIIDPRGAHYTAFTSNRADQIKLQKVLEAVSRELKHINAIKFDQILDSLKDRMDRDSKSILLKDKEVAAIVGIIKNYLEVNGVDLYTRKDRHALIKSLNRLFIEFHGSETEEIIIDFDNLEKFLNDVKLYAQKQKPEINPNDYDESYVIRHTTGIEVGKRFFITNFPYYGQTSLETVRELKNAALYFKFEGDIGIPESLLTFLDRYNFGNQTQVIQEAIEQIKQQPSKNNHYFIKNNQALQSSLEIIAQAMEDIYEGKIPFKTFNHQPRVELTIPGNLSARDLGQFYYDKAVKLETSGRAQLPISEYIDDIKNAQNAIRAGYKVIFSRGYIPALKEKCSELNIGCDLPNPLIINQNDENKNEMVSKLVQIRKGLEQALQAQEGIALVYDSSLSKNPKELKA